jgi:hypothetical protein
LDCPDQPPTTQEGSAFVFTRNDTAWQQQAKLTASDAEAFDYFGYSVFLSDSHAYIGAPGWDLGSSLEMGSFYVFSRSGSSWSQDPNEAVVPNDAAAGDQFAYSIALDGDYAIVGAFGHTHQGSPSDSGAAYIYGVTTEVCE